MRIMSVMPGSQGAGCCPSFQLPSLDQWVSMAADPDARQVEQFEPFLEALYQDVDLAGLATFAIKRMQELQIPVTFENVVVGLFRLFPSKFALHGFQQYPDAARVNRTLLQLGPKYRNWARGRVQQGYVLTEGGVAKAAEVASILVSGHPPGASRTSRRQAVPRTMDWGKELQSLEGSALFRKWKVNQLADGELRELFDLLSAFAYTPTRALRDRLRLLENATREAGRPDLQEFLRSVRQVFAEHLRDKRGHNG